MIYNKTIPKRTKQSQVNFLKKLFKKLKKPLDKRLKVWYNKGKLRNLKKDLTCKYLENGKQYHFKTTV